MRWVRGGPDLPAGAPPRSGDERRLPGGGRLRGPPCDEGEGVPDTGEVEFGVVLVAQHHAPAGAASAEVVEAPAEAGGQAAWTLMAANAEAGEDGLGDDDPGREDLRQGAVGEQLAAEHAGFDQHRTILSFP